MFLGVYLHSMITKLSIRGDVLARARALKGLTGKELAARVGLSHARIKVLETGANIKIDNARAIADELGVPFDELVEVHQS